MDNLDIEGTKLWRNTELANNVNSLLENKLTHIRLIKLMAELNREKYNALLDAGFTEVQALHIITNTGILE